MIEFLANKWDIEASTLSNSVSWPIILKARELPFLLVIYLKRDQ